MTANKDVQVDIPDATQVRVFLPMKGGQYRYGASGVYHNLTYPFFSLFFNKNIIPIESINTNEICLININTDGIIVTYEAIISEIKTYQHFIMDALKKIRPEQMREYFRVQTATNVICKSLKTRLTGSNNEDVFFTGKTLDISASGILAWFSKKPPSEHPIMLEISLPSNKPETVRALSRSVRTEKISDQRYNVAFHFDEISMEDRNKIIEFCLVAQRRLLRLNVKVEDL